MAVKKFEGPDGSWGPQTPSVVEASAGPAGDGMERQLELPAVVGAGNGNGRQARPSELQIFFAHSLGICITNFHQKEVHQKKSEVLLSFCFSSNLFRSKLKTHLK